jgi:transcriptional regulator with XRE-family HTH domain
LHGAQLCDAACRSYYAGMRFSAILHAVLTQRRKVNRSYSLRAFAKSLQIDHATLSQLLRGERRITGRTIDRLGRLLGLTARQLAQCRALEHEVCVLAALDDPRFRADSRWLAVTLNIPLDEINVTLQRLLCTRRLHMSTPHTWQRIVEQ